MRESEEGWECERWIFVTPQVLIVLTSDGLILIESAKLLLND